MSAAAIMDVRRGEEPDEIELTLADGTVLIAHGHGVHLDERRRSREALIQALESVIEVRG